MMINPVIVLDKKRHTLTIKYHCASSKRKNLRFLCQNPLPDNTFHGGIDSSVSDKLFRYDKYPIKNTLNIPKTAGKVDPI